MLAVRRVRLPLALGEVVLLAAAAVRGGEQGQAVGGDLQGGMQGGQGGVLGPRGIGASSWQGGGWLHGRRRGYWLLPAVSDRVPSVVWLNEQVVCGPVNHEYQ